jgi:hypothetical protein
VCKQARVCGIRGRGNSWMLYMQALNEDKWNTEADIAVKPLRIKKP